MVKRSIYIIIVLLSVNNLFSQSKAKLTVIRQEQGSYIFVVQHDFHLRFGLAFPMTYRFKLPAEAANITIEKRYSSDGAWKLIPVKHKSDIFNDEEAVRFDYEKGCAFVSTAFGAGDSLFIRFCDSGGNNIDVAYTGITKYYDDRKAAVTISADDWYDEYNLFYKSLLDFFRTYGLYVTAGVTTTGVTKSSWDEIQNQLDKGYVEIASHSRTHPFTPYSDAHSEVCGSAKDIVENLKLPKYYNVNNKQYVYVWIAPSGDYDHTVDSLLTVSDYLVPRLYLNLPADTPRTYTYGDSQFSNWNEAANHFEPFNPTVELGAPYWGGGDTSLTSLNNMFDSVIARGEVYHPMWHPQVLYEDINKSYLKNHLAYISQRPDIWYVNLGPLYLYHMVYEVNSKSVACVRLNTRVQFQEPLVVLQKYRSLPHPYTTIRFRISKDTFVNLNVYSASGERAATLVNTNMSKGSYEVNFDSSTLESGAYVYQLVAGADVFIKKIILQK